MNNEDLSKKFAEVLNETVSKEMLAHQNQRKMTHMNKILESRRNSLAEDSRAFTWIEIVLSKFDNSNYYFPFVYHFSIP